MVRPVAKWPVNASDFWGVVTLALFVGLVFTLAVQPFAGVESSHGVTINSSVPVSIAPLRL